MLKGFKKLIFSIANFANKWRGLLLTLAIIFTVSGVALGAAEVVSDSTSSSSLLQYGIPAISLGQIFAFVFFMGFMKSRMSSIESKVDDIHQSQKSAITDVSSTKERISASESILASHEQRLTKVEKIQSECSWYNRDVNEFVKQGN